MHRLVASVWGLTCLRHCVQVLRGDGSSSFYHGRTFLGCDGAPLTFQARPFAVCVGQHTMLPCSGLLQKHWPQQLQTAGSHPRGCQAPHAKAPVLGRQDRAIPWHAARKIPHKRGVDGAGLPHAQRICTAPAQEMMDATLASGRYAGSVEFTGAEADSRRGKRLDSSATRQQLGWAPRWASYQGFMAAGAKDWYSSE